MTQNGILEGFTMHRNTSSRPFVTVTPKLITFSKLAINELGRSPFVHVYFNEAQRSFALQACEQDIDAVPFVRNTNIKRPGVARWGDQSIIGPIVAMIDQDLFQKGSVRLIGQSYPKERIIVFSAQNCAIVPHKK